jgi:hypothetical protein
MHPRVLALFLLGSSLACAGGGASKPAATSKAGGSGGDAARIICEAECRRDARCGHAETDCNARCAKLPVRSPPIWHTDWAHQIATCMDSVSCAHDADEGCFTSTDRKSTSATTCASRATKSKELRFCDVLDGLTDDFDRSVDACLRGGGGFDDCAPSFDWK